MNLSDANLNLIISSIVMIVAVVSVWKDVYKNSPPKKFIHRFTQIGKVLLGASLLFIFINYVKDIKSEHKINEAEKAKKIADSLANASQDSLRSSQRRVAASQALLLQLQISMKDTILKSVDSSYTKSIKTSNEALAKYNIKLIDSLHTVVGTLKLNSVNPQLSIAPASDNKSPVFLGQMEGADVLKIQFISAHTTSYHLRIQYYLIVEAQNSLVLLDTNSLTDGSTFVNENVTHTVFLPLRKELLELPKVTVVLSGTFSKDPFEKDIIPYLETFVFDFKDNKLLGKGEVDHNLLRQLLTQPRK